MSCLSRHCMLCVQLFKWLPVLFITTIVAWSYYAYVIQLCIFTVESYVEKTLYLLFYHGAFVMFVWAYWQTIFTEPGHIPRHFFLSEEQADRLEKEPNEATQQQILENSARQLPILCRNYNGTVRYCEKCHLVKPDRSHHCSVCSRCVLKMDHHCPWVNNCVSFTNYKFFVLFLGYAIVYCVFVAATTASYFVKFWTGRHEVRDENGGYTVEGWGRLHILFLFFVAIMFAISLVSLFCYHCYLVTLNRTTLESFRSPVFRMGPDKHAFSLGRLANFREVFGDDKKLWFIPVSTSLGNGIEYPTRGHAETTRTTSSDVENGTAGHSAVSPTPDYRSMGETEMPAAVTDDLQKSVGDGVSFPQRTEDLDTDGLLNQRQKWTDDETEDDQELDLREVKVVNHSTAQIPRVNDKV